MLTSYLISALRNISRHKKYSAIMLGALTLGLVPVIVVLLYTSYELGFDKHNANADRIFRVTAERSGLFDIAAESGVFPAPFAPALKETFPEVEAVVRLQRQRIITVTHATEDRSDRNLLIADPTILRVFVFSFVRGNADAALARPNSLVLSHSAATRYFGDEDPIGRRLGIRGYGERVVTGVIADVPAQSHFAVDFIVPAELSGSETNGAGMIDRNSWGFSSWFTYLLLRDGTDPAAFASRIASFLPQVSSNSALNNSRIRLQALTDIHLDSRLESELGTNGDRTTLLMYATIALITLLIGCISYVNLATMRSSERAREVGVRKTFGAMRSQLILQFMLEAGVLTTCSTLLALGISIFVMPTFNRMTGSGISVGTALEGPTLSWVVLIAAVVALCAGSYPALVVSRKPTAGILRGIGGGRPSKLRQGFILAQAASSLLFLIFAFNVQRQLEYCRENDFGYNAGRVVVLPTSMFDEGIETAKSELLRVPGVELVSATTNLSDYRFGGAAGRVHLSGMPEGEYLDMCSANVDEDYLRLFGIRLVEGSELTRTTGETTEFLLNETAMRMLGWEGKAVGHEFETGRSKGRVVGVIADFNQESLREPVRPMYLTNDPSSRYHYLAVRHSGVAAGQLLTGIEGVVRRLNPKAVFRYEFFDDIFRREYRSEETLGRVFAYFSALAVVIACLGIAGLVSLTTAQRTKEIGIRKVMGATGLQLSSMLTADSAKWVLFSPLLACPVGFFILDRWLSSFAYRTDLTADSFVYPTLVLVMIVASTAGIQTWWSTRRNPVEALRDE